MRGFVLGSRILELIRVAPSMLQRAAVVFAVKEKEKPIFTIFARRLL